MLLEQFAVAAFGPAADPKVVCAQQTAFVLGSDEKLESFGLGIHIGTAEIATPRGKLIIQDGDAWAKPKKVEEELLLNSGVRMVKAKRRGSPKQLAYAVYGSLDGSDWGGGISKGDYVVAWITGDALQGNQRDDSILERIRVVPFESSKCTYRLDYGWDVILDNSPE